MGLRLRSDLASIIDCRLVEGQCPRLGTGTTLAETLGPRPNDIALGLTLWAIGRILGSSKITSQA